ncbi:hypothetical protein GH714_042153 [Hevea brasiliensis]|uniref:Uncharacterized protein n=1 Tax=Hevea brasiliensis TaxID=3981 RepID=A0A6A6MSE3_HEVBR|nr:hypothetical protein GH714_042153 [Hevea brasiliensis]
MSCSFSLQIPKALPCPSPQPYCRKPPLYIIAKYKPIRAAKLDRKVTSISRKPEDNNDVKKFSLAVQLGALLATVEQPAFAVTGVNNEEDLTWVLIQLAIVAFWYFLIMPDTTLGTILNFRKFPRDPSLKYPGLHLKTHHKSKMRLASTLMLHPKIMTENCLQFFHNLGPWKAPLYRIT